MSDYAEAATQKGSAKGVLKDFAKFTKKHSCDVIF